MDEHALRKRFEKYKHMLPDHMRGNMEAYIFHRVSPGGFLYNVLANDLRSAVAAADHINAGMLDTYVRFMFHALPSNAWGSEENVKAWLKGGE